jgi:hypothetical protein
MCEPPGVKPPPGSLNIVGKVTFSSHRNAVETSLGESLGYRNKEPQSGRGVQKEVTTYEKNGGFSMLRMAVICVTLRFNECGLPDREGASPREPKRLRTCR